jgi:hypothetical protein
MSNIFLEYAPVIFMDRLEPSENYFFKRQQAHNVFPAGETRHAFR